MMYTKIFVVSLFFIMLIADVTGQNAFTAGDNGTFEQESGIQEIIDINNNDWSKVINIARSGRYFHQGDYSLRVEMVPSTSTSLSNPIFLPFNPIDSRSALSIWIYIPATENENSELRCFDSNNQELASCEIGYEMFTVPASIDNSTLCTVSNRVSLRTNQWVRINPLVAGFPNFRLMFRNIHSLTNNFIVYIDDVEARLPGLLEVSSIIGENNSVSLTEPSGGFIPFDGPITYSTTYFYYWRKLGEELTVWDPPVKNDLESGKYQAIVQQYLHVGGWFAWNSCMASAKSITIDLTDGSHVNIIPLCEVTIPLVSATDNFSLDNLSGQFVFQKSCSNISLGCIGGQITAPQLTNVVSASATTYSDQWNYTYLGPQGGNDYENGQRGKWRPQASYAYNVPINYQATPENHRAGTFSLSHFNWQYPAASTKSGWLKTNTIERYTPNGDPVQERNALNIASVAKFGYGGSVPYLIAQNVEYEQVMFESFENATGATLEDGVLLNGGSRVNTTAHSGSYSLQLTGTFSSRSITAGGKNIQVRFWIKGDVSALRVSPGSGSTIPGGLNKVAASGAWTLYEAIVQPGSSQSVTVFFAKQAGGTVWLDDVRLQPVDAAMTCYVYETGTLRLLTVFDDQHFGLYYQYNDEGKLVRKQVETERGLKTIQETQYNLPQSAKNP